jgi:hypothetical protein
MSINGGHYAVSNFHTEIDGEAAGYLTSFTPPKYEVEEITNSLGPDYVQRKAHGAPKVGEASAAYNISQAGKWLDWSATVWNKQCVEKDIVIKLANQNYKIQRGIDMQQCTIVGIEFPELKGSDGKKALDVTVKFQPYNLNYTGAGGDVGGKLGLKAKAWMVNNFEVHAVAGLKTDFITSIGLPKITPKLAKEHHGKFRLPVLNYSAIEFSSIKIEGGAAMHKSMEDLAVRIIKDGHCEEKEFFDILIDMKNQKMDQVLGTFTLIGCGVKSWEWAPKLEGGKEGLATGTLECMVEDFRFELKHK